MLGNNKGVVGIIIVIFLIVGGAGAFFFLNKQQAKPQPAQIQPQDTTTAVSKLSNDDIGLSLSISDSKKQVKFSIAKLPDIKEIEYEITYEANASSTELAQGSDTRIQRGITGDVKSVSGQSSYDSPFLDLGSCSKKVCRYDSGVTSLKLTLKLTKSNGKVFQAEKVLTL